MADIALKQNNEAAELPCNEERLRNIPKFLRIKVQYEDEAIIVVDKPCNLRSVPGHANPPPASHASNEKERRMTAQEAWISAIRGFRDQEVITDISGKWLHNLAMTTNLASVPRKWSPFRRYCQRNQQRLSMDTSLNHHHEMKPKWRMNDTELDSIARRMHGRIQKRQIALMNLPTATDNEESAFGQLILLGYAADEDETFEESRAFRKQLYVVHRLDCEVSVDSFVLLLE